MGRNGEESSNKSSIYTTLNPDFDLDCNPAVHVNGTHGLDTRRLEATR